MTNSCINAGYNDTANLPAVDFDGAPRIIEGVVDIGAHEFQFDTIVIEGEAAGTGDGIVQPRSNASSLATLWLQHGQVRAWSFELPAQAHYTVQLRYSNDNFGPLEDVEVLIDGATFAHVFTQDTEDFGYGWDNFVETEALGTIALPSGVHTLHIKVTGGDGYGVEIDVVTFTRVP